MLNLEPKSSDHTPDATERGQHEGQSEQVAPTAARCDARYCPLANADPVGAEGAEQHEQDEWHYEAPGCYSIRHRERCMSSQGLTGCLFNE